MIFGTSCVIVGKGREGIQIGLELASFFCSSLAFNVLLMFITELFPTSVRNSATSLAKQAVALGLVFALQKNHPTAVFFSWCFLKPLQ